MLKLLSWNVQNCGKDHVSEQVEALSVRNPHIVALQDVNVKSVEQYKTIFVRIGLPYVAHTLHNDSQQHPSGVLIASCFPLNPLPIASQVTLWPEGPCSPHIDKIERHWARRTLFVSLKTNWGIIDLYNAYITPGSHAEYIAGKKTPYHWLKIDLLSGIYQTLSRYSKRPRILCGDFNTPQEEHVSGEITTWGYWRKKNGDYILDDLVQHEAELHILRGLATFDMPDVYRSLHGYANNGTAAYSWNDRRYDHVFASKALSPHIAEYLHDFRINKLSDHSPIEVIFEPDQEI